MNVLPKSIAVVLVGLLAAGCAKFTEDGGMAPVTDSVRKETGRDAVKLSSPEDMRRARERVQTLLAEPLTEDTAVQVALLNNRGLQAAYNDLGISEADYVQASLPPNPAIVLNRTFGTGSFVEFGFQLVGNLLAFATLPSRTEIARREFEEARYRAIAEHSGDVVLNIGVTGIIDYASPSAFEQVGCAPELLIGQSAADLVDPQDRPQVIAAHRRALMRPGSIHTVEFRPLLSIGAMEWCEMVTRAVVDERGQPSGVISTIRDMSRHKARQRALQQVAARDSLTGADSRRAFLEKLEAEILRTRHGVRSSLLLIDIDHFKAVNDVHGHGVGDEVLTAFVDRLTPGLSAQDSIGRLGGEEFAILLPDSDIDRASLLCERLRALLRDPIPVSCGKHIGITFSAGLVELDDTSTRSAMLEAADKALYRAKHSGRNCLRLAA